MMKFATNYSRGRDFEYRVRDYLLRVGAVLVVRAAGSHGAADLVAIFPSADFEYGEAGSGRPLSLEIPDIWLVQVKRDGKLPKHEREALLDVATKTGCNAVLAKRGVDGVAIEILKAAA